VPSPTLPRIPIADVRHPTDHLLTALHVAILAGWPQDEPHQPPPTFAMWCADVRTPSSGDPARLLVAPDAVGCALVELPSHDNPQVALAELVVAPQHRRRGVGSALWAAVLDLARAERRRSVVCEARPGSAMEAFLEAQGAAPQLVDVRRHQPIATLDLAAVRRLRADAERRAAGYRLEAWVGPTPVALRGALAAATHALNDAPLGGLDYDAEVWDAGRVAARDAAVAGAGLRMHTVLALAADGEAAGYTDVAVSEDGTYAWQWGTAVAYAHRGHRLGMLMKATMVERLRALEPALQVVATWNADVNTHMIAVNEALGYVPVDRMREWQVTVA
jgi:GNAT superfamily N-acetyltransferase